ncbi:hypothetical protein KP001_01360 [Geomonas subterranea]|uniref:Uncharacterized protein n=1 Tax=Geomonas subterranea TaxID=2847989 RepID=A0ABX8LHT1_9BACT|nr:hypothetical protein [Geomonas subterranea]QXE91217.1 hypothetical protein KP001_01360 [Geomonas subterranea]QXM10696.1 hypothetical protein KP002_06130 [Geomonas subterranea]
MTDTIFKANIFWIRIASVILVAGAIIVFISPNFDLIKAVFALICIVGAVLCWSVPSPLIIVDDTGIKLLQRGISGKGHFDWAANKNECCEWDAIYSVSTWRSSVDCGLTTFLHYSTDPNKHNIDGQWIIDENYQHGAIQIEARIFRDYYKILETVNQRAVKATYDSNSTQYGTLERVKTPDKSALE